MREENYLCYAISYSNFLFILTLPHSLYVFTKIYVAPNAPLVAPAKVLGDDFIAGGGLSLKLVRELTDCPLAKEGDSGLIECIYMGGCLFLAFCFTWID